MKPRLQNTTALLHLARGRGEADGMTWPVPDVARLLVREVVGANRYVADLTLGLGTVVHDYLA